MITEELGIFIADFGVKTDCGNVSGLGLLDEPDEDIGGLSISTERTVTVITSEFESVAVRGAEISVDGTDYKVRALRKIGDGKFAKITLEETA